MNKKAMFSAAVLLAMGTTAGASTTQATVRDLGLSVPLPGTTEYTVASKLGNDAPILANYKKGVPKKK